MTIPTLLAPAEPTSATSAASHIDDAAHATPVEDEDAPGEASKAILDVVSSTRTDAPITAQEG